MSAKQLSIAQFFVKQSADERFQNDRAKIGAMLVKQGNKVVAGGVASKTNKKASDKASKPKASKAKAGQKATGKTTASKAKAAATGDVIAAQRVEDFVDDEAEEDDAGDSFVSADDDEEDDDGEDDDDGEETFEESEREDSEVEKIERREEIKGTNDNEEDEEQEEEEEDKEEEQDSVVNWYTIRALWSSLHGAWFVIHWLGYDQLADFSIQERDEYICAKTKRRCMTDAISNLYVWNSANEANDLLDAHRKAKNRFGRPLRWLDLWTMTFEQVFRSASRDTLRKIRFNLRRKHVLQSCVKALWPLSSGDATPSCYLVHLVVDQGATAAHYDKIAVGFFVFDASLDVEFFNHTTVQMIMQPFVAARYPWQSGTEGVAMIRANIGNASITYQQLQQPRQAVAQTPHLSTARVSPKDVDDSAPKRISSFGESALPAKRRQVSAPPSAKRRQVSAPSAKCRRPTCMDSDSTEW